MKKVDNILKYLKIYIMVASAAMMFVSCENSITVIQEITKADTLPDVSAKQVTYYRSDSGKIQMQLKAPVMDNYEGKKPKIVFPEGFEAIFFDSLMQPSSRIRANYGINFENVQLMEARNDVVVENFNTNEILNTESLYWDQRKKLIFTKAFVKITSPDKVIFGDSLNATEGFDQRTIHNIRGTLEIEEEQEMPKNP
ncbi:MAG: LPS export ABC transporter periplasmic protein LptC [Bacteroidales bacterium]|nr:LPS export ABC transporter periplasmic protein LptC [Bacteroidales bacterium]